MGNYRFKLSDMIPNAWFYKLRDMGKSSSRGQKRVQNSIKKFSTQRQQQIHSKTRQFYIPNRPSYYYSTSGREETEKHLPSPVHPKASDTHFPVDPPRKSSKRRPRRKPTKKMLSHSLSSGCSCGARKRRDLADYTDINGEDNSEMTASCTCWMTSSNIIIDMASNKSNASYSEFSDAPQLELKPILTRPSKPTNKLLGKEQSKSPVKGAHTPPGLHRLRLRVNSPRIVTKKVQASRGRGRKSSATPPEAATQRRRGPSQSFAVVKSSLNPEKDFRESMMEMIVENNIRASKDLEELLACYLSLNSNEYHDVIIKVFEQVWLALSDIN